MKRAASATLSPRVNPLNQTNEQMKAGQKIPLRSEPCKVPKTAPEQNPSGKKDTETVGIDATSVPLKPLSVNENSRKEKEEVKPSAKEVAAAKAARIRLGYEKDDGLLESAPAPKLPAGEEPSVKVDVEYINTEDLQPLANPKEATTELMDQLVSKDWVVMCKSLNVTRQLAVHHTEDLRPMLEKTVPAVVKLVRNPRSSVCKTAIMCSSDLFNTFKDGMLPLMDIGGPTKPAGSLLSQLLLKASSNDKQFVVEEARSTLTAVADNLAPAAVLDKLSSYAKHRSPKVRGKAAVTFAAAATRMTTSDIKEYGLEKILKTASALISDNTPDAREAARKLLPLVKETFLLTRGGDMCSWETSTDNCVGSQKTNGGGEPVAEGIMNSSEVAEEASTNLIDAVAGSTANEIDGQHEDDGDDIALICTSWEDFCRKILGSSAAVAVLKITQ